MKGSPWNQKEKPSLLQCSPPPALPTAKLSTVAADTGPVLTEPPSIVAADTGPVLTEPLSVTEQGMKDTCGSHSDNDKVPELLPKRYGL